MLGFIPLGVLLIDVVVPYFLSLAIGAITTRDGATLQANLMSAGIAGISGALCNFIGFQAITHQEGHSNGDIRTYTFASILNKDVSFFINTKIGGLTSKYIDFGRSHITLQDLVAIRTSGFVLSFVVSLFIVGSHNLLVAIGMLVLCAMLVVQVRWSRKKRMPWRHARKRLNAELNGAVADSLTNSIAVKTFSGEAREEGHIREIAEEYRQAHRKDIGFLSSEGSVRVAVMVLFQLAIVFVTARYVWDGKLAIWVAIFTLAYLQRFASYLFVLGEMLNGYDKALLEAQPMTKILNIENRVTDKSTAKPLTDMKPSIVFHHVSYRYSDSTTDVIRSLTLKIPYGQKVGLVGYSGAGKTTLTQLLLRFDDVTDGSIMLGGRDVRDITQHSLRSLVSFVPQEPLLFHRTLRENIAYGKPDATETEILRATRSAYAENFINDLPHGLDTIVGERGVKLSGGQRQRIAIARAILKDAPMIVLDEATSALDSKSEKLIQQSLETLMKGRTSIVIAHRLSTIAKLDRIVVLDHGRIIEDGPHGQLIDQNGIYAKLWKHQSGGFIEE